MFQAAKKTQDSAERVLQSDEIAALNSQIFQLFPRLGSGTDEIKNVTSGKDLTDFPQIICQLPKLKVLDLSYQGFHGVPASIGNLKHLRELYLSNCPLLVTLPATLGNLIFQHLLLAECPSLKTPPREIVDQGEQAVVAYLRRLQSGSVTCKRTKLMFVGLGGAGKTRHVS